MSELPKGFMPLPLTIGASRVRQDERITGTPSKMYPILRDLGETKEFKVYIEIDMAGGRIRGSISGVSGSSLSIHALSQRQEHDPPDVTEWNCVAYRVIPFKNIIAFRVLATERV